MPRVKKIKEPEIVKPIATLNKEDREVFNTAHTAVRQLEIQLGLMKDGLQALTKIYQEKYDLPDQFNYDPATGDVFES